MAKKPKYIFDGIRDGVYVRAWKEGRGHGEIVVQVWKSGKPDGEPDGDWGMPGIIGDAAIDQAVLQTK